MGGHDDVVAINGDPVDGKASREQRKQRCGQGNGHSEEEIVPSMCSFRRRSASAMHRVCGWASIQSALTGRPRSSTGTSRASRPLPSVMERASGRLARVPPMDSGDALHLDTSMAA